MIFPLGNPAGPDRGGGPTSGPSAGIESLLQHTRFAHPEDSAVLASLEAQKQDLLSATAAWRRFAQ